MASQTQTTGWQKRKRRKETLKQLVAHLALAGCGIFFFLPFYWLVSTSLKTDTQVFAQPPVWIPHPLVWENYPKALNYIPFLNYLKNTLFICIVSVAGTLLSCSLVAYSLSRIRWPGRDIVFIVLIATLMLPGQVTMIPVFSIFKWLGWIDTFLPLTVPAFMGNAFFIFLLRQFFMTIPLELSDAGRIDGCSELGLYWRLLLPLAKPALATVALFTFMGAWNDFMGPLIYLNDETKYTLSQGLQQFVSQHGAEWSMLMAASTVMVVPIIVLFFFTQRTFIQGITLTGIKG
ncbi:MAG: carbohydrate ABC transporter permease [Armatimonadetes bacterium]|nr:carbohydrate ABC transporter permease [Armatimonadota bacterium]